MGRTLSRFTWLCAVLAFCVSAAWGTVRYVPEVYPTICDAVAVAVSGDIVSIAPGTYRESVTLSVDGVVLESRDQAATTATTIITGDNGDGTYRPWVIRCEGTTGPTTEIRYLTITGASASTGLRGGICVDTDSDVVIRNNIITGNSSGGSSPATGGGGVYLAGSTSPGASHVTIQDNDISDNYAWFGGGAIYCGGLSTVTIEGNLLDGNTARYLGGAIQCELSSSVVIRRNLITSNYSMNGTGAIATDATYVEVHANYFADNSTGYPGDCGGIEVSAGEAVITCNILHSNSSGGGGAGAVVVGSLTSRAGATIVCNTLVSNSGPDASGLYVWPNPYGVPLPVTVTDNILAGGPIGPALCFDRAVTSDYNCLWNNVSDYGGVAAAGPHDLAADPLFVSSPPGEPGDFELQATSPCIDAGTDSGAPTEDYAGRSRPQDGDNNGSAVTDIGAYEVGVAPVADFSGTCATGCAPLEVCFTDLSTNDPTSWSWDFGDGGSSTAQDPCHTYENPGCYDVTLTVCDDYDCDTLTLYDYICVSAPPVADFSGDVTTDCAPLEVCFTDLSTYATSWSWDFGDGGSSTAQDPCHTYENPGLYTVSLTVCNDCGCDTETKTDYIQVTGAPTPGFSGAPARGHAPLSVQFADLSTGPRNGWFWEFGDGGTSDQQDPSHEYQIAGRYTVRLTVTNDCGATVAEKSRYVLVSFTDVPIDLNPDLPPPDNHWALKQILACVEERIVGGYPDGTYRPTAAVSRDQMAVFVSRALGGPTSPPVTATFSDVRPDHWAFAYIEHAVGNCVVGGYPDGTYRPLVVVTRDQMAVFIARAIVGCDGYIPTGPAVASFPDVPLDYWAYRYVEYIRGEGVTGGYPDGKYHPEYPCTRDQMAVYVQRAFSLPL